MLTKTFNRLIAKGSEKIPNAAQKVRFSPYVAAFLTVAIVLAIAWVLDRSEQQRFLQALQK